MRVTLPFARNERIPGGSRAHERGGFASKTGLRQFVDRSQIGSVSKPKFNVAAVARPRDLPPSGDGGYGLDTEPSVKIPMRKIGQCVPNFVINE